MGSPRGAQLTLLEKAEPVIEYMPGWNEDLTGARAIDELPATVRDYLDRIEALLGAPVSIVSVGPERTQTLLRP